VRWVFHFVGMQMTWNKTLNLCAWATSIEEVVEGVEGVQLLSINDRIRSLQ